MLYEILNQLFKKVNRQVKINNYDKYIKRHYLCRMVALLLYQQSSNNNYGRPLVAKLKYMCAPSAAILSQGELSKKLCTKLPVRVWKNLYSFLVDKSLGKTQRKGIKQLIRIVDSSALTASLSMSWAKHRSTKNGLKIHMMIDSNLVPEKFRLKNGKSSDKKSLRWAIQENYTYIFDKGYNDYSLFEYIIRKGAHFVTRAMKNISYTVVRNKKIGKRQKEQGILADKIIQVVVDKKRNEHLTLRYTTYTFTDIHNKSHTFSFLSDLKSVKSEVIAQLYKKRWQIEVVFRWIKMFLAIRHWMSRNRHGVLIQLYSALILYLLSLLVSSSNSQGHIGIRDVCYQFLGILFKLLEYNWNGQNIAEFYYDSS